MIRYFIPFTLLCATLAFASCGDNEDNDIDVPTEEVVPGTNHNVLVAYFSEPLPDGVDASTSASRVIVNGDLYGSVEYMAMVISEATGADVVRIQTATPYPGNFDDLASQADNERQNDIRPALATEIENFDDYDVLFVGYPIWWYQMPMAMYSFFDEYDFTGKTLIPFSSHGGSGWSGTDEHGIHLSAMRLQRAGTVQHYVPRTRALRHGFHLFRDRKRYAPQTA